VRARPCAIRRETPRRHLPACDVYLQTLAEYVRLGRTPILKDEDGARVLGCPRSPSVFISSSGWR
jgi:hypothetical protein